MSEKGTLNIHFGKGSVYKWENEAKYNEFYINVIYGENFQRTKTILLDINELNFDEGCKHFIYFILLFVFTRH
jgi:hypothetical protein